MKYNEALLAWNPQTDQVRIGRLIERGETDWTEYPIKYFMTGGAAYKAIRETNDHKTLDLLMFIEFHTLVVRDVIPIEAAHRQFLKIEAYRKRISRDIKGAEDQ